MWEIHRTYATAHALKLNGLTSNTAYDVVVTAETEAGQQLTAETRLATLKQRLRVTLREIRVDDNGDLIGDGEWGWDTALSWAGGSVRGCFPLNDTCEGDYGEGRNFPRLSDGQFLAWTFAEENFDAPLQAFDLKVYGYEMDPVPGGGFIGCIRQGGCPFNANPGTARTEWQAPEGVEWASTPASLRVADLGAGWDSTVIFTFELFHDNHAYPAARNTPSSTWP